MRQKVLDIKDSANVVGVVLIDGNTAVIVFDNAVEHVGEIRFDVNIDNVLPTRHHSLCRFVAETDDAFQNLLDRSEGQIDYRMKKIMEQYDLNEPDQKVAFLNDATDMLSDLPNRMASEVYAGRLASETGISKDVLMNEVEQKRKRKQRSFRRREENNMHPERNAQPAKREFRYEDVRSAKAEEGILRLIARDSSVLTYPLQPAGEEFSSAELRTIFEAMKSIAAEGRDITTASLSGTLSPDQMSLLSSIDNKPESMQNLQKAWNDYTNIIKEQYEIRSSGEDLLALRERIKKKGDK